MNIPAACSDEVAILSQVAYLLVYGELPSSKELARWDEALMRHSAVPDAVERAVAALPHDAHFMGIVLTAINALSTVHPEQNPALAGQNIYKSKEIQDKQIVRLIGVFSEPISSAPCASWRSRVFRELHGNFAQGQRGPMLTVCLRQSLPDPLQAPVLGTVLAVKPGQAAITS